MHGISGLAQNQLVSQERFCSMGFSTARQWPFSSKVPHILATMVTTATGKQMKKRTKLIFTHTHTDYENQWPDILC